MALTKVEAAKLTQDLLLRGVIETIVKESSVLQLLPFMEVTGTAVTYNREATMPAATFYDVGRYLDGGDADLHPGDGGAEDPGRRRRRRQLPAGDLRRPERHRGGGDRQPGEGVAHKFNDAFYQRRHRRSNAKAFDGLTKAMTGRGRRSTAGTNGGAADARPDGPGHRPGEAGQAGRAADEQADAAQARVGCGHNRIVDGHGSGDHVAGLVVGVEQPDLDPRGRPGAAASPRRRGRRGSRTRGGTRLRDRRVGRGWLASPPVGRRPRPAPSAAAASATRGRRPRLPPAPRCRRRRSWRAASPGWLACGPPPRAAGRWRARSARPGRLRGSGPPRRRSRRAATGGLSTFVHVSLSRRSALMWIDGQPWRSSVRVPWR